MVVAQLVEQLLPTPEIRGLNPNIGIVLFSNCKLQIENTKIKKKRPGMAHVKKSSMKPIISTRGPVLLGYVHLHPIRKLKISRQS